MKSQSNLCNHYSIVRGITFRNEQKSERFSMIEREILQLQHGGERFIERLTVTHPKRRSPFQTKINLPTDAIDIASVALTGLDKIMRLLK